MRHLLQIQQQIIQQLFQIYISKTNRLAMLRYIMLRMLKTAAQISQTESPIIFDSNQQLMTITLNRPKSLNALNRVMMESINDKLPLINKHQCLWLQGAGTRAFCAGGDIKAYFSEGVTDQDRINLSKMESHLYYDLHKLNTCEIACWDGIAMGSGVGISIFGTAVIATENTVFAMPQARIGLFTDAGATHLLSRLRRNIGYYLGLTANTLKGEDVYIAGLANYFIPSSKLGQAYQDVVKAFSNPKPIKKPKETIIQILKKHHKQPERKEIPHEETIEQLFSLPSAKEIYHKAASSDDGFSQSVAKTIKQLCPVSVQLIHRIIKETKTMQIKEVINRDFYVLENMTNSEDFKEGVRCRVIEKGAIPKWTVPDLDSVKEEHLEAFLTPKKDFKPLIE